MMNPHIARDSNKGTITRIRLVDPSPKATPGRHDRRAARQMTSRFTRQDCPICHHSTYRIQALVTK